MRAIALLIQCFLLVVQPALAAGPWHGDDCSPTMAAAVPEQGTKTMAGGSGAGQGVGTMHAVAADSPHAGHAGMAHHHGGEQDAGPASGAHCAEGCGCCEDPDDPAPCNPLTCGKSACGGGMAWFAAGDPATSPLPGRAPHRASLAGTDPPAGFHPPLLRPPNSR